MRSGLHVPVHPVRFVTAAALFDGHDRLRAHFRLLCGQKCFASDTAMAITTDAVELMGRYEYIRDYPASQAPLATAVRGRYGGCVPLSPILRGLCAPASATRWHDSRDHHVLLCARFRISCLGR